MELVKAAITKHKTTIPGIEGYILVVSKIEENVSVHPDISIEACRALIEGLCKKGLSLLHDKYIGERTFRNLLGGNFKKLIETTYQSIFSNYTEFLVFQHLSTMIAVSSPVNLLNPAESGGLQKAVVDGINKITKIRHERGDISHGRNYPKAHESSVSLAKSIQAITDGICSFMIEGIATQYGLKTQAADKLVYEDLEAFNQWLDETHNVHSIQVDYSSLLYQNAYEKYEEVYYMEYLLLMEEETDDEEEPTPPITSVPPKILDKIPLVSNYDPSSFWTDSRTASLKDFARTKNLAPNLLQEVLDEYYFTQKIPLRDKVENAMLTKPSLTERSKVLTTLTDLITAFADQLQENPPA